MTQSELNTIIEKHKKWLNNDPDGNWANLCGADLCNANLRGADLRGADLRNADLRGADLRGADLCYANLRGADLCNANLRGADLRNADLCGVNLDYSCLPLWCGSLGITVDRRIAAQIAYHFCRLVCDGPDVIAAQKMLAPLANQFHRVNECGAIEL